MKRPQPDLEEVLKREFIQNASTCRKLVRYWGTTTVDGVEVLHKRRYYFPYGQRPANYEKLFRYLGAYEDIKENFTGEGLESAWLYFNKNKGRKFATDQLGQDVFDDYLTYVLDNLALLWWDSNDGPLPASELKITTNIVIEPSTVLEQANPTLKTVSDVIALGATDALLKQAVIDNFNDLWLTSKILHQGEGEVYKGSTIDPVTKVVTPDIDYLSPDDPWLAVLARYVLTSVEVPNTITDVTIGLSTDRKFGLVPELSNLNNTIAITLEIPYYQFTSSSALANKIAQDFFDVTNNPNQINTISVTYSNVPSRQPVITNAMITQELLLSMSTADLDTDPTIINRNYISWLSITNDININYNSIWYGEYLRADALRNPRNYGLTFKELAPYVLSILDSGYKKKKVSFFKKLIAIVIFIIAVIYAPGGTKGALSLAKAVLFASLVMQALTFVFSSLGATEWAAAFASVNKTVEPLVNIASIVVMANSAINALAKEGSKSITLESISEFVTEEITSFIDDISEGLTDMLSGDIFSDLSLDLATKVTNLVNKIGELKLESINDRNKDLKAEYEKIAKELHQENNILLSLISSYSKPATADWSMYAATYDWPYERGGGPLNIGNIQRTTKQALRKASYDDPAFDNILII